MRSFTRNLAHALRTSPVAASGAHNLAGFRPAIWARLAKSALPAAKTTIQVQDARARLNLCMQWVQPRTSRGGNSAVPLPKVDCMRAPPPDLDPQAQMTGDAVQQEQAQAASDGQNATGIQRDAPRDVDLADGSVRSLSPAHIQAETIAWWITTGVICGGSAIALVIFAIAAEMDAWLVIALAVALLVIAGALSLGALRWPAVSYRHRRYIVTPLGLEIRRGVVWRGIINVPRSRVQHTDVMQGPIQRKFDLATLTIHTAGTEHATVALEGLSHAMALRLRDFLIRAEPQQRGRLDDAV
jgi:membrane protein YdbS with pleckstrin-like domain